MANVNIPDLAALTAPAATDEIEVYDASAAANVRLALSYVALTGTANVFTANQEIRATTPILTLAATLYTVTDDEVNSAIVFTSSDGDLAANTTIGKISTRGSDYGRTYDIVLSTYLNGTGLVDRLRIGGNGHILVGTPTDAAQLTVNGAMALVDGMTAPSTTSGWAKIYVDSADGDLKVKFGDGTTKTIMTDT